MSLQLVDLSPEAAALRSAAFGACNELTELSIEVGGLAALLRLIGGNTEHLTEQQGNAFHELANMAQRIDNEMTAIGRRLSEAWSGKDAPAS